MRERFSEMLAQTFFYYVGIEAGKEIASHYLSIIKEIDPVEAVKLLLLVARAFGYCTPINIKYVGDSLTITLSRNWEGEALKKLYDYAQYAFSKGILEGYLSTVLGEDWVAKEVKCVAKGDFF